MQWKRLPQERSGTFLFSGTLYVTQAVANRLTPYEIAFIFQDMLQFVKENNGADYFQVYENDRGEKLYFIDQLDKETVESGHYPKGENHSTLLFSFEY